VELSRQARIIPSDRVLYKDVGGEAVLLDLETETYFGLNGVGARLWHLLAASRSLGEVQDALMDEFDVAPEVLTKDVLDLVEELLERRLVRLSA